MVEVCGYEFEGPFIFIPDLSTSQGVYLVMNKVGDDNYPLDCGEAENVRNRIETHDRKDCWEEKKKGSLVYYQHLTPGKDKSGRMEIEGKIRDQIDFPCPKKESH